jgi:hypothetical protein
MARFKHISIAAIATVALVAVLASPASARVVDSSSDTATAKSSEDQDIVFRSHPVNSPAAATPLVETVEVEVTDSGGFDWGAASIGAAAVFGIGMLISGAVLFNRRRHRPVAHRTAAV